MVKHNNRLPNPHLHKWWQRFVRVNFNQKIKQTKRRKLRKLKQKQNGLTPIEKLHPFVQCPTRRYNFKTRLGKGFSLPELKAVKLNPNAARTIGICVDKRRKNRCRESLERNVERLRTYLNSLVMIPLKGKAKKGIGGIPADATPEVIEEAKKNAKKVSKNIFKLPKPEEAVVETMEVSKIDKKYKAFKTLIRKKNKLRKKRAREHKKNTQKRKGAATA